MHQMSIFDLLDNTVDINSITEEEMVERISNILNVSFKYNSYVNQYEAKIGNLMLQLNYSNYSTIDNKKGKRFISAGYSNRKEWCGAGSPCDSLQEAIDFFKRAIEKYVSNK